MNYLFIITSLNQGGAEKKLLNIIKYLRKDKLVKILLVVLKSNGKMENEFYDQKIEIINMNLNYLFFINPKFYLNLIRVINFRSNFIVSWLYHANIFSIIFKLISFRSSKLIWNIRQTLDQKYYINFNKKLIIYIHYIFSIIPNLIIFNSKNSRDTHAKFLIPKNNNILKIIYNSFDGNEFYKLTDEELNLLRKKFNLSNNDILISNLSRYHSMKNHKLFIKIANLLIKINSNYKFLMCGDGIKSKYSYLQNDNFMIFDNIKNINEILNLSDCVFLTSSYGESFPSILAESMLSETLVISTNVGMSRDLISDYGLLINDNLNINEINNFIKDNFKNKKILELSRKKIISNYSIDKVCKFYIKTLHNI